MKRLAFYAIVIASTLAFFVVVWQFRSALILLVLSLVLTAALRPSVDFLVGRGLRPGLARVLVYLLVIGVLGLGLSLISGPLLMELQGLSNNLVVHYDNTYQAWVDGSGFQQAIAARLPAPDQLDETIAGPAGASALQFLFGVTQGAAATVAALVVVIVLSLYWSADREHFERLWLSLLPAKRRIPARRIWQATEKAMGDYVRSEFIQAFLALIALTLGYRLIGLDYPILMGLLAGVAWLIPMAGFVIIVLGSFLFGLASSGGLITALGALALAIVVLAFLEFVIEPRLFKRSQFSGMLIILLMVMMVDAYGLVGFLIAPPLAVAIQVMAGQTVRATRRRTAPSVELESLEERLAAAAELLNGDGPDGETNGAPPEYASLHQRLGDLLAETRRVASKR